METLIYELELIAPALLLVAIVAIAYLLNRQNKLAGSLQQERQKNQRKQEILNTRIDARDELIARTRKELHDNLGQLLNSSKLLVSVTRQKCRDDALDMAHESLGLALREVRSLSSTLNRDWLEEFDFVENLRAEAQRINHARNLVVTLDQLNQLALPGERQLMLFRMVQDLFQTASQSARASHIRVTARQTARQVEIEVTDDGRATAEVDRERFELQSLRKRTSALGGMVERLSGPNGNKVVIQLPLS